MIADGSSQGKAGTDKMSVLADTGKMSVVRQDTGWKPVLQEFDPDAELDIRERNLPHWEQHGATYFVTFRLADSLPQEKLRSLRAERFEWLRGHPEPISPAQRRAFGALFSEKIEAYLAAGYGACRLKQFDVADVVEGALRHFDGQRYGLGHYVVMPNHVHLLVTPAPGRPLAGILHSWKSFTSNQINKLLQRRGTLWQDESFDHLVRDEDELRHYGRYIVENPRKAGLREGEYRLGVGLVAQASSLCWPC